MQQHALKEYSNDPAVWQSIPWGGPHHMIRSCGRGHIGKSDPPGGATSESPIPREGPYQKVRSCGRGHSGKSDPPGGATTESPIRVSVPVPVPAHVPVPFQSQETRSCGRGHTVGSNPPGGPQQGISFEFEYLGEFEFIFGTALGYESRSRETCFDEKKCMQKISRYCPFKFVIERKVQSKSWKQHFSVKLVIL